MVVTTKIVQKYESHKLKLARPREPKCSLKTKNVVRYYKFDALFLSETLVHSNKTQEFSYILGFDNCFTISSNGRSGGITLFCHNYFKFSFMHYSSSQISVEPDDPSKSTLNLQNEFSQVIYK